VVQHRDVTSWLSLIKIMNIEKALSIGGWMSQRELLWLAFRANLSKTIMEIGCHRGRSTRAMADNTSGVIYAVDPWVAEYYNDDGSIFSSCMNVYDVFEHNLKDHIQSGRVIPVKEYSYNLNPLVKFDFTFIDGDHRYHSVKQDIEIALKSTKTGGVIAGHDYTHTDWPGVKKAVDEFFGDKIKLTDSIWWVAND